MSKYRIFLGDHYETGTGSVISILIVDSNYPEEFIEQEIVKSFDAYFADSVQEVEQEVLKSYENYLPRYVISVLSGQVTPGAFRWHSQFMINFG